MRFLSLDIFQSDFRFHLVYTARQSFFVFYNDENLTVSCSCPSGKRCEHTAFIYERMSEKTNGELFNFLVSSRDGNSQPIRDQTVERMRGAFAREYNLANGIVQYSVTSPRGPRAPLGWEGNIPGWREKVRVVEIPNQPNVFAVYETNSDRYSTVECTPIPKCNHKDCQDPEREVFCKHEAAVREAIREWRRMGLMPRAQLTMVEKAEPIKRTGELEDGWLSVTPGKTIRGIWKTALDDMQEELSGSLREQLTTATTAGDVTFDFEKFEGDINKAKKLLEKKEKPKPEKPKKPRTRFTDLEL